MLMRVIIARIQGLIQSLAAAEALREEQRVLTDQLTATTSELQQLQAADTARGKQLRALERQVRAARLLEQAPCITHSWPRRKRRWLRIRRTPRSSSSTLPWLNKRALLHSSMWLSCSSCWSRHTLRQTPWLVNFPRRWRAARSTRYAPAAKGLRVPLLVST